MFFFLWLGFITAAASPLRQYGIAIQEGDITFTQNVTEIDDDLVIISVPKHHQNAELIVYLDHKNNYELTKFVQLGYCQLSLIPVVVKEQIKKQQKQAFTRSDNLAIRSTEAQRTSITKLQFETPMSNLSFLRQELKEGCGTWPVFWTESMLDNDVQMMMDQNMISQDGEYILKPDKVQATKSQGSCASTPGINDGIKNPNDFVCSDDCGYHKCKVTQPGKGCYYMITCKRSEYNWSTNRCEAHIATGNQKCKPCCMDPLAPGAPGAKWTCTPGHFSHHCNCARILDKKK